MLFDVLSSRYNDVVEGFDVVDGRTIAPNLRPLVFHPF